MRALAVVLCLLLFGWVIAQALGPDEPDQRSFQGRLAEDAKLKEAERAGLILRNPERERLRQAVLRTAERLDQAPCNEAVRKDFARAARAFLQIGLDTRDDPPVETVTMDGLVLNATRFLDREAVDRAYQGIESGQLRREDLPPAYAAWVSEGPTRFNEAQAALNRLNPESRRKPRGCN